MEKGKHNLNVLAVGAHPDDIEFLCAGTLARYASLGHNIIMAVFTSGGMGDFHIKPEELVKIRKSEAIASTEIIGARLLWPGVMDEHVFPNESQRRIMIDLLRESDPDIIFTHSPLDYHPDHRYVSQLVFDSYFQKGLPNIPNQKKQACRFAHAQIYYMDTVCGLGGFMPSEYVDITNVIETKRKMLSCHKSQFETLAQVDIPNLLEMIETQARFRGLQLDVNLPRDSAVWRHFKEV